MRYSVNCRVDKVRYVVKIVDVVRVDQVRVDQVGCSRRFTRVSTERSLCFGSVNYKLIVLLCGVFP